MRVHSWRKCFLSLAGGVLIVLAASTHPARAEFVGMDTNGDGDCQPLTVDDKDMGQGYGPGDVGVQQSFDIFFDDIPNNMIGYGCVFCVQDSTHLDLSSTSWTYADAGWTNSVLVRSGSPEFNIELSSFITGSYTKYVCWLISGVDFSFVGVPLPHAIGTFTFEPASEGSISWVFDVGDGNTGVQTVSFLTTYAFDEPGEMCTWPAATEQGASWGAVKALFR